MRIHCYFINWNDSYYLPFFHKHYSQFCEKLIMYDQYSTDDSRALATQLGIEIRSFGNRATLNDQWYLDVKNNCWKECREKGIDYVIVVDIDEFLVIPQGLTGNFPKVLGFNMVSDHLPVDDIFEVRTGEISESYSKQAIFKPDAVTEINYVHGCHKHNAVGDLTSENGKTCRLFHMRMIGGVDRLIARHAIYRQRLSKFNNDHKMGFHYHHADHAKREEWAFLSKNAREVW